LELLHSINKIEIGGSKTRNKLMFLMPSLNYKESNMFLMPSLDYKEFDCDMFFYNTTPVMYDVIVIVCKCNVHTRYTTRWQVVLYMDRPVCIQLDIDVSEVVVCHTTYAHDTIHTTRSVLIIRL
jgi:hypothetical protein